MMGMKPEMADQDILKLLTDNLHIFRVKPNGGTLVLKYYSMSEWVEN